MKKINFLYLLVNLFVVLTVNAAVDVDTGHRKVSIYGGQPTPLVLLQDISTSPLNYHITDNPLWDIVCNHDGKLRFFIGSFSRDEKSYIKSPKDVKINISNKKGGSVYNRCLLNLSFEEVSANTGKEIERDVKLNQIPWVYVNVKVEDAGELPGRACFCFAQGQCAEEAGLEVRISE